MAAASSILLGGMAANALGGLAGAAASSGDRAKALQSNQQAVQQWLNVNVPDPEQQKIYLKQYVQTGQLDPKLQTALKQGPSALAEVQTDPGLKNAQLNALAQLQSEGALGGMGIQDQATLAEAMNNASAAAAGRQGAIQNSFAARGLGGSGLELAAQLQNAQNATQNQNSASLNAASAARQRALDAILQSGNLAGNIRGQDYTQAANAANAQDAISRFNTQNMQSVNNQNAAAQNAAQEYNLGMKQGISNKNTDLGNYQDQYNKNLIQQQYQNQVQKASGMANAYTGQANAYNNNADRTASQYAGIGSALGQGASTYADYLQKQQKVDQQPQPQTWTGNDPIPSTDDLDPFKKKDKIYG